MCRWRNSFDLAYPTSLPVLGNGVWFRLTGSESVLFRSHRVGGTASFGARLPNERDGEAGTYVLSFRCGPTREWCYVDVGRRQPERVIVMVFAQVSSLKVAVQA